MKLIHGLICLTSLVFSLTASAGLYLEPYYYKSVVSAYDEEGIPSGFSDVEGDVDSVNYGLKAGWLWANKYLVGLEYSLSETKLEVTGDADTVNTLNGAGMNLTDKFDGRHYGAFVANKFPAGFGWLSGGLSVYEDTNDNSSISKGDKFYGFYYGVGAGWDLEVFMLSVQYRRHTLSSVEYSGTGTKTSLPDTESGQGEIDIKEIQIGISFPLKI